MGDQAAELLAGIELDLINDSVSTASLLRKCLILGGRANSEILRRWASQELNGYDTDSSTPAYRTVGAIIMLDAIVGNTVHTGHVISSAHIPKLTEDQDITENVTFRQDIGELEELSKSDRAALKFSPPLGPLIAQELDKRSGQPFQQTQAVYWSVTPATIGGIVGRVRTALAELVADLITQIPPSGIAPPPEVFDSAVSLVFTGDRPSIQINSTSTRSGNAINTNGTVGVTTMGDTFSNISGSNIVNRSLVTGSLNSLEQAGKPEEAEALRQLAQIVEKSENTEAADCLNAFNEELGKVEPRKTILRAMWDRIVVLLPYAANTAAIATGIGNIIS